MTILQHITDLENDATEFGFAWEKAEQIMAQIQDEWHEINAHLQQNPIESPAALQEEIGDLLHAVFSLCVFCKFDPEKTLNQTTQKFEKRLQAVKNITQSQGHDDLKSHSFDQLMAIWNQAKEKVG